MDQKQFRGLVNAEIENWALGFPLLTVVYENGPVPDEDTLDLWLDVAVRGYTGKLLTMGSGFGANTRTQGAISLQVYKKRGEGTAEPDDILVSVQNRMKARHLGSATLYAPTPMVPAPDYMGWYRVGVLIPFSYDG